MGEEAALDDAPEFGAWRESWLSEPASSSRALFVVTGFSRPDDLRCWSMVVR